ncbi:hypothetical protein PYCC9005_003538 [Savitreella phatthalungensis]
MSDLGQQSISALGKDKAPLTQEQLWQQSEGLHAGGLARTVDTTGSDERLEGTQASRQSQIDSRPDEYSDRPALLSGNHPAEQKASLGDRIKGQAKIALGTMKSDSEMITEGEDLKAGDKDKLH